MGQYKCQRMQCFTELKEVRIFKVQMPNTIERDHQMIICFLITNTRKLIAKTGRRISCV